MITGTKTLMDIYARKILDQFVDPYSMINGYEGSDEHWERKRKQYLGDPVFPDKAVVDWGRTQQPLQLRVVVWRSLLWQQHQCNLNTVCNDIMLATLADEDIMPIHRYRQARRAFNVYLTIYASTSLVKSYRQLMAMRVKLLQNCITTGIKQAEESFFDALLHSALSPGSFEAASSVNLRPESASISANTVCNSLLSSVQSQSGAVALCCLTEAEMWTDVAAVSVIDCDC